MFKRNKSQKLASGRKYTIALIMMLAMLVGFGLAGINPVLTKIYADLLTGLGMIFLTYCGGNVGNKWVIGRKNGLQVGTSKEPPSLPTREV